MAHPSPPRIPRLAMALLLFFLTLGLSLPRGNEPFADQALAKSGAGPIDTLVGFERRASSPEADFTIFKRTQRLYPLHFTKFVASIATVFVAQELERFYDDIIAECQARMQNGVEPGNFVDISINKLKLIAISQGTALTWAFFQLTIFYQIVSPSVQKNNILFSQLKIMGEDIPYWRANIPEEQWPSECPDFLLNLSERDQRLVNRRRSIPQLTLKEDNQLDRFVRVPTDLRRYLQYNAQLKKEHGSVMDFVVKERLKWTDLQPRDAAPFDDPKTSDIKILYNDWPYGIDERIVHLVVWTKFALPDDPTTNDLALEIREKIDDYVDRMFCRVVPKENVIWFKNWKALKSIHAVEHFHVMLFDPDPAFVEEVTHGDLPLSRKLQ
ncbi:MAG: hypothetical protein Q9181_002469 [Wetmoreana brouardii]